MHPFEDGALQSQPDRSFRKKPVGTGVRTGTEGKLRRHEFVACGEMLDGDGVEQLRWPTIEGEAVSADESRIARVEADVVLGQHGGGGLADQELSVVVDGQGRRPNRNWHALPMLPCVTSRPISSAKAGLEKGRGSHVGRGGAEEPISP